MLQKSQPCLSQTQQSKLQSLQLEIETLWEQVRNQSILNSGCKTEVDSDKPIVNRDRQFHSV